MEDRINPWEKIMGQNNVRSHDGVAQIFRVDKPDNDPMAPISSDYYDYINGQTGFLREQVFYKSLLKYLDGLDQKSFRILIVAGSVGCEAYKEARKRHDVPYLEDIDPILSNMCALSRHLVCVNRLEDTPYWHSNRQADRDIFAYNGFNRTINADWDSKPSTDLESNSLAGEYSRKRDCTQVFVRG